jgi:UPF0755 protein
MKKTLTILLTIISTLGVLLMLLLFLFPSNTANWDTEPVRINLPEGCTYDDLRDSLDVHEVVIRKAPAAIGFNIEARLLGLNKRVRPGSYLVPRNMRMHDFILKLRNGQQDPIRLTIGKFRTPQQLNEYLNSKLMHNDFNFTLSSFHLVLPDTYEFYWTVTPEQFMQRMEKEYEKFWQEKVGANGERRFELLSMSDLTPDIRLAAIIIASIVEEETNYGPEKPIIASVYWNRLDRGMPLQADPTVKYAVGDFTLKRILNKHLAVESPFNTYLHKGLPPAPICLPSKATIDAVIKGEDMESNYLYFCASEKMDGTHRFAATLAEHNRNAAAFHRALDRQGVK